MSVLSPSFQTHPMMTLLLPSVYGRHRYFRAWIKTIRDRGSSHQNHHQYHSLSRQQSANTDKSLAHHNEHCLCNQTVRRNNLRCVCLVHIWSSSSVHVQMEVGTEDALWVKSKWHDGPDAWFCAVLWHPCYTPDGHLLYLTLGFV